MERWFAFCFGSGGLGLRWALPRPAKEPQVPWILHLLPRLRAGVRTQNRRSPATSGSVHHSPLLEPRPPSSGGLQAGRYEPDSPCAAQPQTIAGLRRQFVLLSQKTHCVRDHRRLVRRCQTCGPKEPQVPWIHMLPRLRAKRGQKRRRSPDHRGTAPSVPYLPFPRNAPLTVRPRPPRRRLRQP